MSVQRRSLNLVAAGRSSGRTPEAPSQRTPDRNQIAGLETNRLALQRFRPTRDVDRVHGRTTCPSP